MRTVFSLVLIFICNISFAQENNSGFIYGDKHAYSLTAPKGWFLDNESGVEQGLHAVFYLAGSSWAKAATVMYTNFAHYSEGQNSVDELINYDTTKFKQHSLGVSITRLDDIKIKDDVTAKVYSFSGGSGENIEAVAYIPASTGTVLIIMSSRDKDEYKTYYPKFEELVKSYAWFSSDGKMKEKQ